MAEHGPAVTRRTVLRGTAVAGAAAPVLVACGSDSAEGPPTGAGATVPTSEVPVGGGTILADEKVVVTQPTEGEFLAFSAVCPHQGCTVQSVADGRIGCPCHGSAFSVKDGSVLGGPAQQPLPQLEASVDGDQVTVG